MSDEQAKRPEEISVDIDNLYREEAFTDLKIASLRRLTPVKADGSPDDGRKPIFIGQAHVMTPAGAIPIQCPIDAGSLEEAMRKFPGAAKEAVEKMIEEVKEIKRKEASRIVVPGQKENGGLHLP